MQTPIYTNTHLTQLKGKPGWSTYNYTYIVEPELVIYSFACFQGRNENLQAACLLVTVANRNQTTRGKLWIYIDLKWQ